MTLTDPGDASSNWQQILALLGRIDAVNHERQQHIDGLKASGQWDANCLKANSILRHERQLIREIRRLIDDAREDTSDWVKTIDRWVHSTLPADPR